MVSSKTAKQRVSDVLNGLKKAKVSQQAEEKTGFIRGMWCEDQACEDKIKEDLAVTSRCMPFNDQEQIANVCVCCGKPAHKLVYWGKAY